VYTVFKFRSQGFLKRKVSWESSYRFQSIHYNLSACAVPNTMNSTDWVHMYVLNKKSSSDLLNENVR